jgi:hypothetical protein
MSGSASSSSAPARLALDLNVVMQRRDQRGDLGVLAREGEVAALVLGDLRIAEHRAELVVAIGDAVELGAERGFHDRGPRRGRASGAGS